MFQVQHPYTAKLVSMVRTCTALSVTYVETSLAVLTKTGKVLVWLMWGERGFHYRAAEAHNLYQYYSNHEHIHKRTHVHQPAQRPNS